MPETIQQPAAKPDESASASLLPAEPTHAPTLACTRCLEGHIGFAAVLAQEVAEDGDRVVERRLALGNLKAAEWHARSLGFPELSDKIRDARHAFADGDPSKVVGLLSERFDGSFVISTAKLI